MSDTPRTDAELAYDYVLADFARKLERELNAAKADIEALRAMHEAEKLLTPLQCFDYSALLTKIVGPKDQEYYLNLHATATQREEARLQTLNPTQH